MTEEEAEAVAGKIDAINEQGDPRWNPCANTPEESFFGVLHVREIA